MIKVVGNWKYDPDSSALDRTFHHSLPHSDTQLAGCDLGLSSSFLLPD